MGPVFFIVYLLCDPLKQLLDCQPEFSGQMANPSFPGVKLDPDRLMESLCTMVLVVPQQFLLSPLSAVALEDGNQGCPGRKLGEILGE